MAPPRSSPHLLREALALVAQYGNVSAAARAAGIPTGTMQHRVERARVQGVTLDDVPPPLDQPRVVLPQTADECWALLDAAIGRTRQQPKPPRFTGKKTQRIVIASDFHAPFHDVEAVAEMLARTEGYDQLIINGDLQDSYSVSRFTKHESVPWEREVAAVDALLSKFAAQYPDVLIVEGNHDRPRFEKVLRTSLPLEIVHVVEYLTGGEFSTIRALAKRKGYGNIRFAETKVGRFHLGWFAQQGDLIVCHAEKFSRVPGSALRSIEEWLSDRHDTLGLAPWKVLVQAHTHQLGAFPWRSHQYLIEGGAMCAIHGYQLDAKLGGRDQRLGFVTLTQHDGVTDFDSIKVHWLDPMRRAA